jgi:hypothetical protein
VSGKNLWPLADLRVLHKASLAAKTNLTAREPNSATPSRSVLLPCAPTAYDE